MECCSYEHLIQHFEGVSYGDPLFGAFLLLPLQQSQPIAFRMKLWTEHPDAVRSLILTEQQVMKCVNQCLKHLCVLVMFVFVQEEHFAQLSFKLFQCFLL